MSSGGTLVLVSGAIASNTIVDTGGKVIDSGGLRFTNTGTVIFGGTISGPGTITEAGPGTLILRDNASAFSGTARMFSGTIELTSAGAVGSGVVLFAGPDTHLQIDGKTMPPNTISGFVAGDTIDLAGLQFHSGDYATYAGTTLSIWNAGGTVIANLTLEGEPYSANSFALSRDPITGGIDIGTNVPCFAAGTLIATARGDVPVERLTIGDRVLTHGGPARPIIWIGQRQVDCRANPRPELVWPIRIQANAFGDGQPRRDLLLSPGHSVYCDGVLIPAEHLINGATVVQEPAASVHYFHVELDRHDVVFAENLTAESYLDDGNRAAFENGAGHTQLYPDFVPRSWDDACAVRCTEGAPLAAVCRLLHERALALGYCIGADPEIRVLADDVVVPPSAVIATHGKPFRRKGRLLRCVLPGGTRGARIVSRGSVPAWLDPSSADRRELGLRIGGIVVDGITVPLTSRMVGDGFYAIERHGAERWRWTDGRAVITIPERARTGPITLDLFLRDSARYWVAPMHAAARRAA